MLKKHYVLVFFGLFVLSSCSNANTTTFPVSTFSPHKKSSVQFIPQGELEIDIPERYPFKSKITNIIEPFVPYIPKTRVVVRPSRNSKCYCDEIPKRVVIGSKTLFDPRFPKESEVHINHEFFHVVENRIHSAQNIKSHTTLTKAFYAFMIAAGYHPYKAPSYFHEAIERNQLFSLVDESSYAGEHPSSFGHPYSNHGEFFASFLTITKIYSDQFLNRFQKLSKTQKEATAAAYFASINILLILNDNVNDLKKLLPNHEQITEVLRKFKL